VHLTGLRFAYGHRAVAAAIAAAGTASAVPITWRFVRDAKGWRAFATVTEPHALRCGDTANGALGVDVNADHLAVAVADRAGNPVAFRRFDTPVIGTTAERRKAIYGDAAKAIVGMALARRVPVVLEALDFRKKKSELEACADARRARMLSALGFTQIKAMIRSRAVRLGVRVVERNPAYTSLIGDAKFSERFGVSVHLSAALAIARRGMGLSERVPCPPSVTLGNGARVALPPPARMGRRHVWASWARVARDRKAALAGRPGSASGRPAAARRARAGPAVDGSLALDDMFLSQLANPGSAGATPAAKPSPELLGRRAGRGLTYG
jgi:IS605 OrfB family transposase